MGSTNTDELRVNKLAAGILIGGLVMMAGIKVAEILVPHTEIAQNAYVIEVPEGGVQSASAPVDEPPEPILALLANADIAAGEKLSRKCTACHVFEKGGANKVGPALWNVVNGARGATPDFNYSSALEQSDGDWDYQSLNLFLAKPKAYIPGTKMNFIGLKKTKDRANMIAWLRRQADTPARLPTRSQIAAEGGS